MPQARLTLIDTSSWIEALRRSGRAEIRERVGRLTSEGRAAWCDLVALELWNGARGEYEREQLQKLGQELSPHLTNRSADQIIPQSIGGRGRGFRARPSMAGRTGSRKSA